ncbi:MAG TPA: biosynthetic-type acetolactate synthase large subunit [Leptospiraceae bacterium]|nr:biosynthetic-type acetolactate synthase large subunit [Leptospiraceae bacterium]
MRETGAQYLIRFLESKNVTCIAGMPGGSILPVYDALYGSRIQHIQARHEQGACFIAGGIARASGKTGVVFATSGPGAANLLTGLADAKMDSVPLLAVTGQVPRALIGTDAFQELDICSMSIPATKARFFIDSPESLARNLPIAFHTASTPRFGPVLIDIPKDIQSELYEYPDLFPNPQTELRERSLPDLREWISLLENSEKPILYLGGGCIASNASEEIIQLSEKNGIPAVSSLNGLGVFPAFHRNFLGMLGMHGLPFVNYALEEADLLFALGARFDDRATGKLSEFCPNAKILHIDIDRRELNRLKKADLSAAFDIKEFLKILLPHISERSRDVWNFRISENRKNSFSAAETVYNYDNPSFYIRKAADCMNPYDITVTDVGQHQMWTAQVYPFQKPRTFLCSGGLGTMGFGLPSAIGASLAFPEKRVLCISGDGSILLNIQELATLRELNLNVKILILNNSSLGMVRQQQELFYGSRFSESGFISSPDFTMLAASFGIPGFRLDDRRESDSLFEIFFESAGPALLEIPIQESAKVFPMVPPGKANREMILSSEG